MTTSIPAGGRLAKNAALDGVHGGTQTVGGQRGKGSRAALDGVVKVQQGDKDTFGAKARRGVVAALIGITAFTSVGQVQAQDLGQSVAPTQTHALFQRDTMVGQGSGLDLTLRHFHFGDAYALHAFGSDATAQTALPGAVEQKTQQAFARFQDNIVRALGTDAAGLAQQPGRQQVRLDGELRLTGDQQRDAERAVRTLLEDMPIGALSPALAEKVGALLDASGVQRPDDLAAMRIKDVQRLGGRVAKGLLDELKQDNPAMFYSLGGVTAAALGAVTWTQGTEGLARLGIRPELSQSFLDGSVKLRAGVWTGPQFSDPEFRVRGDVRLDNLDLRGEVRLDGSKPFDARLSASGPVQLGGYTGTATGEVRWNDSEGTSVHVSSVGTAGAWSTAMGAGYTLTDGRFVAELSAGRDFSIQSSNDARLEVRGRVDSRGDSSVGVGFRWQF